MQAHGQVVRADVEPVSVSSFFKDSPSESISEAGRCCLTEHCLPFIEGNLFKLI